MTIRTRNKFDPQSSKPFKLSRSKLDQFINCPRCFYLDRRLGVAAPPGFPFNLNSAVDALLKREFDGYRAQQQPHPIMVAYGVDAVPFQHPEINVWRENFTGIQILHEPTNLLITGAIDDVWQRPDGQLCIVDYKSTAKSGEITLDEPWKIGYKRQMEIYQWLFRRAGFNVSRTGYFVYANGLKDTGNFHDVLRFHTVVLPYEGDDRWVDDVIEQVHDCLCAEQPPALTARCALCTYVQDIDTALVAAGHGCEVRDGHQ